jgi:Predicted membrane protein
MVADSPGHGVGDRRGDGAWVGRSRPVSPPPQPPVEAAGRPARALLVVAGLMSLGYGAELLIDLVAPRTDEIEPRIGLFAPLTPDLPRVVFWAVIASWVLAPLAGLVCHRVARWRGAAQPVAAAVLLAPFTVMPVAFLARGVPQLLACLPSTGIALWGVHTLLRRFHRPPAWTTLAAFGWGALVAGGFAGAMNVWFTTYALGIFGTDGRFRLPHEALTLAFLHGAAVEELGKAAGVTLAFAVLRHRLAGVATGTLLGAAVGLGFNLSESVEYMSNAQNAGVQYWMRQSVGIMAAHTAFTALAGAGIAASRSLPPGAWRRVVVASGLVAASLAHFASNMVFHWLGVAPYDWLRPSPTVSALLVQPLALVVVQGPVVATYLVLLRRGLRTQAADLAVVLREEAETGLGAILPAEVPVLLSPARRLRFRVAVLLRYGVAGYRHAGRLHAAQLDLAECRRYQADSGVADPVREERLRERVRQVKRRWPVGASVADARTVTR